MPSEWLNDLVFGYFRKIRKSGGEKIGLCPGLRREEAFGLLAFRVSKAVFLHAFARRFPGVFWAGMFGFDQREYFESVEESKAAPSVTFDS